MAEDVKEADEKTALQTHLEADSVEVVKVGGHPMDWRPDQPVFPPARGSATYELVVTEEVTDAAEAGTLSDEDVAKGVQPAPQQEAATESGDAPKSELPRKLGRK
jgi:hypothetical protein